MNTPVAFSRNGLEVAIIGMAGRFPGAKNLEEFWQNLQNGEESITAFTDEELISSGIDPTILNDPQYVKAGAILEDVESFDAAFFGFNPREAEIIDPQQRLFLECASEALESAGYDAKNYEGLIGVYAGAGMNSYILNLYSNQNIRNSIDDYQLILASDKDFLTTRVSYKLELEGPSVDIQTACSTSLVAVHFACRSLLGGECDIALAGGVAISASQKSGYFYQEGGISSPDGHCRAFDAKAQGTVAGNGVGIVVLKRLEEAIADGDRIHAVIKGSAINNDGAFKVSYTAPRIDTQAKVIRAAQTIAEVEPETITYIEAHGTGTLLGDPIEIAALTQAFRASTQKKGFCAIGSVKTNIGHLDAAAGVTGLIKTVLALKHRQIPPSLHFKQPNPQIDFDNSPFYVNTTLSEWKTNGTPRRAGVSSFGIGGTNAHVILEEAPSGEQESRGAEEQGRRYQLLVVSAKTESALETATGNLVTHLKQHPDLKLADVAYTLQVGRRAFEHRRMLLCQNFDDTIWHPQEQQSDVAFLLNTLSKLWLMGVQIDWSGFYTNEKRHRVPLPTYPFERQRYWIEVNRNVTLAMMSPKTLEKKPDIANWFYIPSWKRSSLHMYSDVVSSEQKSCWLVFVDAIGVGSQIAKKLDTEGHEVITVTVGQQFTQLSNCVYAINPQAKNDYDTLLKELSTLGLIPKAIAHFWSLNPNAQGKSPHQFFEECQNHGFYSLLFLAQALGRQEVTDTLQILVATNNVQEVNGDENLCPEKATVMGICKVIPQEYPNITCRNIDVVIPESGISQENQLIDQLVTEFTHTTSENMVAYRGKHRWVQTFEPVQLEEPAQATIPIREGGVYLITGGLGGIGLVVAEYLAQTARAKLILTSRSSLPAKQDWSQWLATHDENDDISRKIKKVQALEALGAEVLICSADVANLEQMQTVMTQASECFGQVHGVIHAAGIKLFSTVQQISKTECENQLRSTGYGLFVLEKILQGKELDFCVIISSLASVLGVLGMAAYPATHIFTDAFVHKHNQNSLVSWLSINYDNWETQESSELVTAPKGTDSAIMTRQEGLETFKRALSASKFTQIVTSTVDLSASIRKWIKLEFRQDSQLPEKAGSSSFYSRPNLHNAYFAPRSEVEQIISHIWQELLGIDLVGIHDNFFELGGDSVLGIQVIARVAQAGFHLTPQQLFEYQTIAELAKVAIATQVIQAEQSLVTGLLPLAPTQHWFFEQNQPQLHHWNQAVLLEVLQVIDPALLEQALQQLLMHHDALRLRFTPSESGWQQVNASPKQIVPFTQIDLSALSREVQRFALEATANQIQASLNLSTGPIIREVQFKLGANSSSRMLIVIHHLVVDFGSWRILLADLQTAYQQLNQGQAIQLPQKTTSFKHWSFQLKEYADSAKLHKKQDYWLSGLHKRVSRLPIDFPEGINTVASSQTVSVILNEQETQALLQEVPSVYRTNTQEVLLTALVQAFGQWTGGNSLLVDLEGNGREATIENVDISRTVGWFTTIYPVVLDLEKVDNLGDALKVVKEQVRCIDNEGLDYGVLRYLIQDTVLTEKIRSIPQAEVMFLYLGQFDRSLPQNYLFRPTGEFSGIERSPQGMRSHLLEVTASVTEGQLRVDLNYSTNLHRHQTIKELSDNFIETLKSLITHCQSPEVGGYTPLDFSAAKISQESLSKLLAQASQLDRGNPQ